MKMLTEGKARTYTYVVTGYYDGSHGHTYCRKSFKTSTAQEAVDLARENFFEGITITQVAKVVNNWK